MKYNGSALVWCVWCDSQKLTVVSENLYKCLDCGKLTDDDPDSGFERIKQRKVRDDTYDNRNRHL